MDRTKGISIDKNEIINNTKLTIRELKLSAAHTIIGSDMNNLN